MPNQTKTAPGQWTYIYDEIAIRHAPANHTVPCYQMGLPFLLLLIIPEQEQGTQRKKIKFALRPALIHSAEPILCRALHHRFISSPVAAAVRYRLDDGGGGGLYICALAACLASLSFGTRSPGRRVALDSWGACPPHERMSGP